jgi:hypothetical protein
MAEKIIEPRGEAINRLAAEAKKKGVQIFLYLRTGEYYATSTSSPDELHRVTLVSCDCPGFLRHQRCTHHAALLAELDELPPLPSTPLPVKRNPQQPHRLGDGHAQRTGAAPRRRDRQPDRLVLAGCLTLYLGAGDLPAPSRIRRTHAMSELDIDALIAKQPDPLRIYEEAHERLLAERIKDNTYIQRETGEPVMVGYDSADALGPYIAGEAELLRAFGYAIGRYRKSAEERDVRRLRFGEACRSLAVDLLNYASTLTFLHYDLDDKVRTLFAAAPLEYDDTTEDA